MSPFRYSKIKEIFTPPKFNEWISKNDGALGKTYLRLQMRRHFLVDFGCENFQGWYKVGPLLVTKWSYFTPINWRYKSGTVGLFHPLVDLWAPYGKKTSWNFPGVENRTHHRLVFSFLVLTLPSTLGVTFFGTRCPPIP